MVALKKLPPTSTDLEAWLASLPVRWSDAQLDRVQRAYARADEACSHLAPQERESCLLEALAVADILADLRLDHEVIAASLLRAAVDGGVLDPAALEDEFGSAVRRLVEGISRLEIIGDFHQQGHHAHRQLESLRKMLLAMAEDVRVVLIVLAVRLYRMRNLDILPEDERRQVARETRDIFAPLANRLGVGQIKWELEDLALRHLEPAAYKQLARALEERRAARENYIARVQDQLRRALGKAGIKGRVDGRVKHITSIWKKMQRKKLPFEEIFDVRAVRVLVPTVADCYAALGVVHGLWNHISQEFDDYIANPKANGYQSLHTAVVGPEGRTLEVQIRTEEMHQNAELGVAAHWRYKEGGTAPGGAFEQKVAWLRQMLEFKDEQEDDSGDLLERFKAEAFQDRVYAVSPRGEIVDLPFGATPLDFAYHIHTELGHRCRGAKVNGRIVPLNTELKTGDQVEVLTAKQGTPGRDWLNPHLGYLKSSRSRAKVRQWFKLQDQDKNLAAGKASLDKEFQRLDLTVKEADLERIAKLFNFTSPDELHAAIGHGELTPGQVVGKAQELLFPAPKEEFLPVSKRTRVDEGGGEIKIRGVGKLLTQIAPCCKPVPFDGISGFITRGRGVTIHRRDCPNLLNLMEQNPERIIEVDWGEDSDSTYSVDIALEAYDRAGLLRDITSLLANERINVLAVNTLSNTEEGTAKMYLTLEIQDLGQLSRVLDKLGQLPNIIEVRRLGKN